MSYSNGHITAPVSIHDVQQCCWVRLQRTVSGEVQVRYSSDLGVLCKAKVGDTIPANDNNGSWTVAGRGNINPWARYRPIPCTNSDNNKIFPITDSQRQAERYGIDPPIDMFTSDTIAEYENYVNDADFTQNGGYYIHLRPFGDTHWKRLTDFVKTDSNGQAESGKGYNHNAKCDEVTVIFKNGERYTITPLIPVGQRTIYLQDGNVLRFQFPNDHLWVSEYYKYVKSKEDPSVSTDVDNVDQNDEYLSSLDFMAFNTYSTDKFPTVMRSVIIFKRNSADTEWEYLNRVNDKVESNLKDRPYDTYKDAWLDLTRRGGINQHGDMDYSDTWQLNHYEYDTDANAAINFAYFRANPYTTHIEEYHDNFLRNLEGRLLFLEIWRQSNSSTNLMPIQSLAYEVNINRTGSQPTPTPSTPAYISGVFDFVTTGTPEPLLIEVTTTSSPETNIVFEFLINPNTFLVSGDALTNDDAANARLIMARMRNFYNKFDIEFYNAQNQKVLTLDLLSDMIEVSYDNYPVGSVTWKDCYALIRHASGSTDVTGWTAKAVATIKQQGGGTVSGESDLGIRTQ